MKAGTSQNNLAGLMKLIACFVMLLVAFCGFAVLNYSSKIADKVHRHNTEMLVTNELARQMAIVARDQSQISYWDATLTAFGEKIDMSFVRNEIAGWLWDDFEIEKTVVIGPNGQARVSVYQDKIIKPEDGKKLVSENSDLIMTATAGYLKGRIAVSGGYQFSGDPLADENGAIASAYRQHAGRLGIVVAQAMVPSDQVALPDGNPHVLLVFRPIDDALVEQIATKLDLEKFDLSSTPPTSSDYNAFLKMEGAELWAKWQMALPSNTIWNQSLPTLLIVLVITGLSLAFLCVKYGQLFKKSRKSEEELHFLAWHDVLTGLPNRAHFNRTVANLFSDRRSKEYSVLCIDLDRFKEVNDDHGHEAGDEVLTIVASRLTEAVGPTGVVARFGGDEFVALLKDCSSSRDAVKIGNDIVRSVSKPIDIQGGRVQIGASVGVAQWPRAEENIKAVIRKADQALYKAKKNGRGRVTAHKIEKTPKERVLKLVV